MSTLATGIVTVCTSLLLGAAFSHWRVDYGVLWSEVLPGSIEAARVHYQELIELPAWVNLSVIATGALAIGALLFKISSGDPSALMFDGGSLVLFSAIGIVYVNNVRAAPTALEALASTAPTYKTTQLLKDLASSNTIIAVALTGVLTLQAAQHYSSRVEDAPSAVPSSAPVSVPAPAPADSQPAVAPQGQAKSLQPKRSSARLRQAAAAGSS